MGAIILDSLTFRSLFVGDFIECLGSIIMTFWMAWLLVVDNDMYEEDKR